MRTSAPCFFLLLIAAASAQKPIHSALGVSGSQLGFSVAGLGDVNGDGVPDFAAGAPYYSTPTRSYVGWVRVFSGKDGSTLRDLFGLTANELFGFSLCLVGDLDRDGHGDFAVGVPNASSLRGVGLVRLFSGKSGSPLQTLYGDDGKDRDFGRSVAAAGDFDRDGWPDLLVGSPSNDRIGTGAGCARVYSGRDFRVLHTIYGGVGDQLGFSVAGVGDVDADGFADVIVGAPWADSLRGGATVWSGRTRTILYELKGDDPGDSFGAAVAGVGDVDGDGRPDFAVGAPEDDNRGVNSGTVSVYASNAQRIYRFVGQSVQEASGQTVGAAGDVNGDGYADILEGAPLATWNGTRRGVVRIRSGKDGRVLNTYIGSGDDALSGFSLASVGDVDGDKLPDILIGDPHSGPTTTPRRGHIAVFNPGVSSFRVFGNACGTTYKPAVDASNPPLLGKTFELGVRNLPPSGTALLIAGASRIEWLGTVLPMPLDFLGMTFCRQLVSWDAQIPFGTGTGSVQIRLPVPAGPAFVGVHVHLQCWVRDPAANPAGLITSDAGAGVLGL